MKRVFLLLLLLMAMAPTIGSAQATDQLLGELKASILAADAVGIAGQTMNSVEIVQFGEGRFYSRSQATLLLKSFFKDYPPHDFKIISSTKSSGAWFIEGLYSPKKATEKLSFYLRLRVAEGGWKIREFLIERADE
ncbi:MAG: DUF4783 domain-containing protein [Bacteroidetes bacterium]|nr:DUF4783 domain-containing protein [Bacteroidota bacterium]